MTAWLDNVVALNVKASSMQTYRTLFKNQIIPHLGEIKIQELTPALLDKWVRDIQRSGLSYNTISAVHAFIHNALNYAVYPAQLISSNPAAYIKVPKNAPKNVVKRTIITPKQFNALLEKYPFGTPLYIPLLLLYHTGMRLSEVLGLSWADIDFTEKRINVGRQMVYLSKRGLFFYDAQNRIKQTLHLDRRLFTRRVMAVAKSASRKRKAVRRQLCLHLSRAGRSYPAAIKSSAGKY